jgi:ribonuclease HI
MIYTDGSKEKTATSAAVCLYYNNRLLETFSTNLGPSLEIADAESVAILKAIQIASRRLEKGNEQVKTIYICIDSQTAILRLRNNYFHTTQQIGLFTSRLATIGVKLAVVWCPSHIGIEGNELADKLAKKALQKQPSEDSFTALSYLRSQAKEYVIQTWKDQWTKDLATQLAGKQYTTTTTIQPRITGKTNKKTLQIFNNKALFSAYIQLRTGIGLFRQHLFRIGKEQDPSCICGEKQQTAIHLLLHCSVLREERKEIIDFLTKIPKKRIRTQLITLFNTSKGLQTIKTFIQNSNIGSTLL